MISVQSHLRLTLLLVHALLLTLLLIISSGPISQAASNATPFALPTSPTPVYFTSYQKFATGNYAANSAVGDFNGDGKPDFVVTNNNASAISLFLARGNGTFQSPVNYPTASNPNMPAVADFNGDGKLDLAIACSSGNITILLGNGNASFQAPVNYSIGFNSYSLALADFNKDGRLDIVTAVGSGSVAILLGNGDGTFQAPVTYPTGLNPHTVAVGDFNGDGNLDLITPSFGVTPGIGNLNILVGNGNGTFQAPQSFGTFNQPLSVVTADLNTDGRLDLVVADTASQNVTVLLGQGDGTFTTKTSYFTGPYSGSVAIADFNGDGKLDFAAAYGAVDIFVGDDSGAFQLKDSYSGSPISYYVTTADLNGDGKPDLITSGGSLDVLVNQGNALFNGVPIYKTGVQPYGLISKDLNGDNKPDLVSANYYDNNVSILLGKGDGTFQTAVNYPVGKSPGAVVAEDFNGDGKPDIATANTADNTVSILVGKGDGTFQNALNYNTNSATSLIAAGDFNGDGKPDLVTVNNILLGKGDGTFQINPLPLSNLNVSSIVVGDYNRDNKLDFALAYAPFSGASSVSVFLGNGDGTFSTGTSYTVDPKTESIAAGDFNGDGALDLVSANFDSNDLDVLINKGDGTFQNPVKYVIGPNAYGAYGVTSGDFNGDGQLDLAVGDSNGSHLVLLWGKGDGTFAPPTSFNADYWPTLVVSADFNGDGRLDLAASGSAGSNSASILLNQGALTHFGLSAPTTSLVGTSIAVGVIPLTATNYPVSGYSGTIHFSSSDGGATLPTDYSFSQADNGWQSFNLILSTAGSQTVSVSDTVVSTLTGSATINVTVCLSTFTVNSNQDDSSCGTLRTALKYATNGTIINISLNPPTSRTIVLKNSGLNVPKGVTINGVCSNGRPGIILDGSGIIDNGLTLAGNDKLWGLEITHFKGSQLKTNLAGNHLSCLATRK